MKQRLRLILLCVSAAGVAACSQMQANFVDDVTKLAKVSDPEPLVLHSISPKHFDTAGGETVTVTGTGFQEGMSLLVGYAECTNLKVYSSLKASCVIPAHPRVQMALLRASTDSFESNAVEFAYYTILGQPNSTTVTRYARGLNGPHSVATDGERLYVGDFNSNERVQVWNRFPTLSGTAADWSIGRSDTPSSVLGAGGFNVRARGIATDGKVLIISDRFHRVHVWHSIPTSGKQKADVLLGQRDYTTNTANLGGLSASSFDQPSGVAYDGQRLYVADAVNNRILIWNQLPTTTFQPADVVVGQTDFVTKVDGTGPAGLLYPLGVASDGKFLAVSDSGNHRILIWYTIPTRNGQPADLVLGQFSAYSDVAYTGRSFGFTQPQGLCFDGQRLYVGDAGNHRVMIYNSLPRYALQPADLVIGQPHFGATGTPATSSSSFNTGPNTAFDIACDGKRVIVSDFGNSRVLIWNSIPTMSGQPADLVIGQPNFTSATANTVRPSANGFTQPFSTTHGRDGQLFVADTDAHRVLIYNRDPGAVRGLPDIVLGQEDFETSAARATDATTTTWPNQVLQVGQRLLVSERGSHRILVYNSIPTRNNQPADFIIGQPDFTTGTENAGTGAAATPYGFNAPASIASNGTNLIVADRINERVLIWNTIPTTWLQPADVVLGQSLFTTKNDNLGGPRYGLKAPYHVLLIDSRLFVTDTGNNRILIWNSIPTENHTPADYVIGQKSFTDINPNILQSPRFMNWDGQRFWIADMDNSRFLGWNGIPDFDQPPDYTPGKITTVKSNDNGVSLFGYPKPTDISFAEDRAYLTDHFNDRVVIVPSKILLSPFGP